MTDLPSTTDSDTGLPLLTHLSQSNVQSIHADMVRLHQSAAQEINASEVELHISAAFAVKTDNIDAHESALGLINAREVVLTNSGAAAIHADTVGVNGSAGLVLARTANLGNAYSGVVAGSEVRAERIGAIVLIGNHVEGEVHTMLDTRQVILASLISGLFAGLILTFARFSFRRD